MMPSVILLFGIFGVKFGKSTTAKKAYYNMSPPPPMFNAKVDIAKCCYMEPYNFTYYDYPLTWSEANVHCQSTGSTLMLLKTKAAISDLHNILTADHPDTVWSGLKWNETSFLSIDPENVSQAYSKNKLSFDWCVTIIVDKPSWQFELCLKRRPFICQRPGDSCRLHSFKDRMLIYWSSLTDEMDLLESPEECEQRFLSEPNCFAAHYQFNSYIYNCHTFYGNAYEYNLSVKSDDGLGLTLLRKDCFKVVVGNITEDPPMDEMNPQKKYVHKNVDGDSTCWCPCYMIQQLALTNLTEKNHIHRAEAKAKAWIQEMALDKKNVAREIAKHKSADDNRISAVGIGTVGVTILITIAMIIVIPDLITLCRYVVNDQ